MGTTHSFRQETAGPAIAAQACPSIPIGRSRFRPSDISPLVSALYRKCLPRTGRAAVNTRGIKVSNLKKRE